MQGVRISGGTSTEAVIDGFKAITELKRHKKLIKILFYIGDMSPHG